MKAGERDELDQETGLAEVPDERLELFVGVAVRRPVERGRQVVDKPPVRPTVSESASNRQASCAVDLLAGVLFPDLRGKVLSLLEHRSLGLKPEEIGIVGKRQRPLECRLRVTLISSITLTHKNRPGLTSMPPL